MVVITAKDKLCKQLGNDFDVSKGHVCFSPRHADRCTMEENGIEDGLAFLGQPLFDMYSEELSLFVLDVDIEFFEQDDCPGLLYPLLSEHVQHKYVAELDAFVSAHRSKEPPTPSFADGRRGLCSWPMHSTGRT